MTKYFEISFFKGASFWKVLKVGMFVFSKISKYLTIHTRVYIIKFVFTKT